MTHFLALVLIPENIETSCIKEEVDRLLAPYDESLEVEPYINEDGDETTYNPQSRWDWWRIGGRYNGLVCGKGRSDTLGFNFDEGFEILEENCIPIRKIDHRVLGAAIVTPDGVWHERGKIGWFGVTHNPKDENDWEEEVIKVIQQHRNRLLVGVDCHI